MFHRLLAVLAVSSVIVCAAVRADDSTDGGWNFRVTPYLWATSMKGSASIGPVGGDIDLPFSDILANLRMALMLNFRAEKDLWAIQADGVWADIASDVTSGPVTTNVGTTMWIGTLTGRYRFAKEWEALAGARYYNQDVDITVTGGGPGASATATADWIDPVIGAAFDTSLSDSWSFQAQGDIGGFGVGSQFAWQAWVNFDWRFSKIGSLDLGYRHLDWDYEEGSGPTRFTYDAYLSGPVVGVSFRF